MLVLGVTGGIGTGKTTVSSMFRELGAEVIDADQVAHELLEPGSEGANKVRELFGEQFVDREGAARRHELARIVFADPESRRRLEGALHPLIADEIRRRLGGFRRRPDSRHLVVIVDAPVLLEAKARDLVDWVVVVFTDPSTQKARLRAKGGWTDEEVDARIASQMPLAEKVQLADFVIDNGGDVESTRRQVRQVWSQAQASLAGQGEARPQGQQKG